MLFRMILVAAIAVAAVIAKTREEKEEARMRRKERKPGKTISVEENGDVDITIRFASYELCFFKNLFLAAINSKTRRRDSCAAL